MKSIHSRPFSAAKSTTLPCSTGLARRHQPTALLSKAKEAADYQHLQELLAQMPVAMYLLRGPAHVLELVNLPAVANWGCSLSQVQGKSFFEALPHLRGQGYEAAYATVWQTHQGVRWHESPISSSRQPGEPAALSYFDVSFQPFHEGPGRLAGILVTSYEVTEQVLARQRMHQATAELAATNAGLADYVTELTQAAQTAQAHAESQAAILAQLLEQAPTAIGLLTGANYVVQLCNPHLLARWGRTLAQVLHQPLFEALPELHQHGLQELLEEVSRTGAPAMTHQLPGQGEPLVYYPVRDAQGQTIAIAALAPRCEYGPACQP